MRGTFAQETEVPGVRCDSSAEMMHPNSIHIGSSQQRVDSLGQHLGKLQPSS